jgi:hypothetical protein
MFQGIIDLDEQLFFYYEVNKPRKMLTELIVNTPNVIVYTL